MRNKLVSVIIPAYNEQEVLPRLFSSIKKQTYRNIETILVDDSSTDSTYKIAKKFTKKAYTRKHAERSMQRNFGASKARGQFYLFLDADMELTKDVIEECVRKVEKNKKVGAMVVPEESVASNYWERVKAFERSFYNEKGDKTTDAARFFTKEAFEKAGGYDETITGPEDWDLPETIEKMGYRVGRVKSVIYHHERIKGPIHVAKKKFYYGLKAHRYLKKQGIGMASAKTIYFLRPVFYKKFYKFIFNPVLALGMFVMLTAELVFGGAGFLLGKIQNR